MSAFLLHPQLSADTLSICDLPICRVLLMNNRHFPWLILVPRREGLRELFDLTAEDYQTVMDEVRSTAETFAALAQAHKMNIAALGNQVPQLHIHIIARRQNDSAWPQPVWNAAIKPEPYEADAARVFIEALKPLLRCNITKM